MSTSFVDGGHVGHLFALASQRRSPLSCPAELYTRVLSAPLRGKRESEARRIAKHRGCEMRVVKREGVEQSNTFDLRSNRVNVATVDGRVSRVLSIF